MLYVITIDTLYKSLINRTFIEQIEKKTIKKLK
jgi:hypothetical protein